MSVISCQQHPFGTLETGEAITCYSLRNTSGMVVNLLNYGATLQTIQIPDSRGKMHDIIRGFNPAEGNNQNVMQPGATAAHLPSRYGTPLNQLHTVIWSAESMTHDDGASVEFTYEGLLDLRYPYSSAKCQLKTRYTLTTTDELIIHSDIQTSTPLPIFMTHHPVWNLGGIHEGDVADHVLQVWGTRYSTIDEIGFPNYQHNTIEGKTAFDFKEPQRIGERWAQLSPESNYDICFVRDILAQDNENAACTLAARVKAPISGRTLEVYSTQTGLRFYLDVEPETKALKGVCLSPLPALQNPTIPTTHFSQSTRYKLIW